MKNEVIPGTEPAEKDRAPQRSARRDSMFLLADIASADGKIAAKARIRNLSETGMMADCDARLVATQKVLVDLRGIGKVAGSVAWKEGARIGVAFEEPIDPMLTRQSTGSGKPDANLPQYLKAIDARTQAPHPRNLR